MSSLQGRTVLVADDERYITSTLAAKIRSAGARVVIANDGAEALALAAAERPDLILTDFQMPVLSGLEFATKLKTTPETCDIPVVMLTARGHKLSASELSATNIKSLLAKPFSVREVMENLESLAATLKPRLAA